MKKYILVLILLVTFLIPNKVNATTVRIKISCDESVKLGEVGSCKITGTGYEYAHSYLIKNINFNFSYEGLSFVSFEPNSQWNVDSSSADSLSLSLISGTPAPSVDYDFGTLKVKAENVSNKISITDYSAIDTNNNNCDKNGFDITEASFSVNDPSDDDNNSLTSVIFDGYDINFDKDKLDYEFTVSNDLDKLMYCVNKKVDKALCFNAESDFDSKSANMKVYFNDKLIPYYGDFGDATDYEYDESTGRLIIDLSDGSKMVLEMDPNGKFANYYINDELVKADYVSEDVVATMTLIGNLKEGTNIMKIVNTSESGKEKTYTFKINKGNVTSTDKPVSSNNSGSDKGSNGNVSDTSGFGTSNSGTGREYDVITSSPATGNVVSLVAMAVLLVLSVGAIIYSRNNYSSDNIN